MQNQVPATKCEPLPSAHQPIMLRRSTSRKQWRRCRDRSQTQTGRFVWPPLGAGRGRQARALLGQVVEKCMMCVLRKQCTTQLVRANRHHPLPPPEITHILGLKQPWNLLPIAVPSSSLPFHSTHRRCCRNTVYSSASDSFL